MDGDNKAAWFVTWKAGDKIRWRIYDTKPAAKKGYEQNFRNGATEPKKISVRIFLEG